MENATDALIMAGSVLIFLIALSVCVSSFTTLRAGIDRIVDQTETVDMAQNSVEYINYISRSNAIRVVGAETVVSSMYRAKKENYVIYIVLKNLNSVNNYNELLNSGKIFSISKNNDKKAIKLTGSDNFDYILGSEQKNRKPNTLSLYSSIKDKKFEEYLGVYQDNTDATEENKITYRIITYVEYEQTP